MTKYIIGIVGIIVVIAGILYLLHASSPQQTQQQQQSAQQGAVAAVATSTYATSTFSVVYPVDFTVDPAFENTEVSATKPISGIKFTIPESMATGTDLAADSFVSIETLPHAQHCTGDIYLAANVQPTNMTDGGIAYSVAIASSTNGSDSYEEDVYALSSSSPCMAVRYFIHTSENGSQPFDSTALLDAFDAIRHSLTLVSMQ